MKIVVAGTGFASILCINHLVSLGLKPIVLDVGNEIGIEKRNVLKKKALARQKNLDTFHCMGGLSNVWTGVIDKYLENDFADWPINKSELDNYYQEVFKELNNFNVMLEGIVLKPNMVISGLQCEEQADIHQVSEMTVNCLKANVPESVPGIAFLSGGQTSDLATDHLNCMNKNYLDSIPWNLTFSYGRALQADALEGWGGNNRELGQENLIKRAKFNSMATTGSFSDKIDEVVI